MEVIRWARRGGYEVSTKGDRRFSALCATMPDGRTIEMWYQCDIKGYEIGGANWRLGKGKPPLIEWPEETLWRLYRNLWELWTIHNLPLMKELKERANQNDNCLSDCFANTKINQARALAEILNEWFVG